MAVGNQSTAQGVTSGESSRREDARPRADRIRRLLRYTGVNLVSLAVDYAVFFAVLNAFAVPVTASVTGYAVAFAVNYKLSRWFVFGDDGAHKGEKRLFTEFMASGVFGVLLTAAVTSAGLHLLALTPTTAKTAAVLLCFVALYLIRSRLVFTRLS